MSPPVNEPVINVVGSVIYAFFFTVFSFVVWGSQPLRHKTDVNECKVDSSLSSGRKVYEINAVTLDCFTSFVQMVLASWCIALIFAFGFRQSMMFNLPVDPESSYFVLAWIQTVWIGSLITTIFYLISMFFKFFSDHYNDKVDGHSKLNHTPVFGYGMVPLYKYYARPFLVDDEYNTFFEFNGEPLIIKPSGARFNFFTSGVKSLRCLFFYLPYYGFLFMMFTFIGAVETNNIYPYPGRPATSPWDSINVATVAICAVGILVHSALQSHKLYSFIHRGELYGDHCGRVSLFCLPIPAIIAYNFALFGAYLQFFNNVNPFVGAVLISQVLPLFMSGWTGTLASWLDYHIVSILALTHVFFFTTDLSVYNVPNSMGIASGTYRYLEFWQDRNVTSGFYSPQDQMAVRYLVAISGIVSAGFLILNVIRDMSMSNDSVVNSLLCSMSSYTRKTNTN